MAEVVRLVFGESGPNQVRHKIAYRHRDLREACEVTGKSITELLKDPFGGWAYLVQFGRRQYDPRITKDQASDLIDAWLADNPDNDMDKLGALLMRAIENANFLKFAKPVADSGEETEQDPEGNAQTQTPTTIAE